MELRRLTGLGRVTRDLAAARDVSTVTEVVTRHVAEVVSADLAILAMLEGDEMVVLGRRGETVLDALNRPRFPLSEPAPLCDAARTGAAVVLVGRDAVRRAYPEIEAAITGGGDLSYLAYPLRGAGADAVGALALRFAGADRRPEQTEVELLSILADVCSQTLLRLRAEAVAAERARKLEFLSAASEELAHSLDQRQTLTTVARLAVDGFADWCGVQVLEDGRLTSLAVEHRDPAQQALAHELMSRLRGEPHAPTASQRVIGSGRSEVHSPVKPDLLTRSTADPGFLALARRLELLSAIVVPLSVRGRITGTMTFGWSWRLVGDDDLGFAEDLARRAAVAIDNADLFSQTQRAAQTLQHALLPHSLPQLAGWEVAALYLPSGRAEVGGDFYDVIDLSHGRHVVVLGDVMGRGVDAAAAAARLQAGVRALVAADSGPAAVASGLDRLFELSPEVPIVTMACLAFDRCAGSVDILVAGHLPPLLVDASGGVTTWDGTRSPAFGIGRYARHADRLPFSAGETVLLYTDGLVERRDEDVDTGIERLAEVLRAAADEDRADLQSFLTRLTEQMRPPGASRHDDDVAIVAVRRLP